MFAPAAVTGIMSTDEVTYSIMMDYSSLYLKL